MLCRFCAVFCFFLFVLFALTAQGMTIDTVSRQEAADLGLGGTPTGIGAPLPGFSTSAPFAAGGEVSSEVWFNPTTGLYTYFIRGVESLVLDLVRIEVSGTWAGSDLLNFGEVTEERTGIGGVDQIAFSALLVSATYDQQVSALNAVTFYVQSQQPPEVVQAQVFDQFGRIEAVSSFGPSSQADVLIQKTGTFLAGTIAFSIQVVNNGPGEATGIVVTDVLPSQVAFNSDTCGGVNLPPWTWNVGTLASGASVSCDLTVSVNAGVVAGLVSNTAVVQADQTDPDSSNDTSSVDVLVSPVEDIPVLGFSGLAVLFFLLIGGGFWLVRKV